MRNHNRNQTIENRGHSSTELVRQKEHEEEDSHMKDDAAGPLGGRNQQLVIYGVIAALVFLLVLVLTGEDEEGGEREHAENVQEEMAEKVSEMEAQTESKPAAAPRVQPSVQQPVPSSQTPANVAVTLPQADKNTVSTAVSTQQRVSKLLTSAEKALAQYRLTTPSGDNAHHYYEEVLVLDPGNKSALAGIDHIVEQYSKMAKAELGTGDYRKADAYVSRGLTVQPDDPGLRQLQNQVSLAPKTQGPAQLFQRLKEILREPPEEYEPESQE